MNINSFSNNNLYDATVALFAELGVKLNSNTTLNLGVHAVLGDICKDRQPFTNVTETYFAGLVDDTSFKTELFNNTINADDALESNRSEGLMIFALHLDKKPNRTEIAELTRAFNQRSKKMPVLLVLKYDSFISLALPERFLYKQIWRQGEKIGKTIILRDIDTENTHRGHKDILDKLSKHNAKNFNDLHRAWLDVLNINVLNKKFYAELMLWYEHAFNDIKIDLTKASLILGKNIDNELKPQAVIRIIVRMMFIWFMKQKELIDGKFFRKEFVNNFLKDENKYYNAVLQNLFFAVLNCKIDERRFSRANPSDYGVFELFRYRDLFKNDAAADEFLNLTRQIPFINGGLFQCHDYKFRGKDQNGNFNTANNYIIDGFSDNPKDRAVLSDDMVFALINIFESYIWTIEESTPEEQDVALDPELLGTVFENIIGAYNPESKENARKASGSFYTPKSIVDYMCRESFKETLKTKFPDKVEQIDDLIDNNEDKLDFPNKNNLLAAITSLKVLDPACGSGAFPMGMFNLMVRTIEKLQEHKTTYRNKLDIIQNCIYGIDIQNIAIEISKLRFFISLLVDYETPADIADFGVLPNLETKFAVANTLIDIDLTGGDDLFQANFMEKCRKLTKIFLPFTNAKTPAEKTRIKNDFENEKKRLLKLLEENHFTGMEIDKIREWNPFNVCCVSPFFDSNIMFGIADGFDIVIGNPPYVDYRNIDINQKPSLSRYEIAKHSTMINLYTYFIEKGINLLKEKGHLIYITPQQYLILENCKGVRDFVRKYRVVSLFDFSNVRIFDAGTYPFISFMQKLQSDSSFEYIEFNSIQDMIPVRKLNLLNPISEPLCISDFFSLIEKIEKNGDRMLSDFCSDIFCASSSTHTISANSSATGFITAADIQNYYVNPVCRFIDKTNYSRQSIIKQTGNVIYTSRMTRNIRAFLSENNNYLGGKVNVIKVANPKDEKFLLAIINSKLISFWYREKYSMQHMQGGYLPVNTTELKVIPVPSISFESQHSLVLLVNYMLLLRNKNSSAVSNIVPNDIISNILEELIDACVFELYFEDEIKPTNTDVLKLLNEFFEKVKSLPVEVQIKQLYDELNEYKGEIRNRIILQETRSESVAQIIKSTN